ncbi:metal ABC transporter ATP-binding protein [Pelagibius sp. Alg239-R121]|uniref:ATP-binding cassette domain-containing protein n=1 Tax=Pelagibius sp. Alg239-R121 TaxID=2993448 RepID=UPI0024A73D20|nr:metal ABC transporter ATP-binding protein [Pelagibius sp. Alg239-R121]
MIKPSGAAEALVEATGVGLRRAGRWLVSGVDLTVNPGEIVTLIGPNGSGKSTTAKIAVGIQKPDIGDVRRRPGLRIGYVPQKLTIDWTLPLTVERLMTLTGRYGAAEITRALEEVGIANFAKAEVQHLSGGEFQRALLARAMIGTPDLLVLDEPVQGVDFAGEVALYNLIREIRDRTGCGILLISHDLHVVMAETDTVVCLNGHVCCRGTPDSVVSSPEYLELFGSRAAETLAIYRHNHDHTHLPDGRIQHPDGSIHGGGHVHGDHAHCDHSSPQHDGADPGNGDIVQLADQKTRQTGNSPDKDSEAANAR